MGETYTRIAVDSASGSVLLYSWSVLLFALALRTSLRLKRSPVTLVLYTMVVSAFMLSRLPMNSWTQTYLPFLAVLSAAGIAAENYRRDEWWPKLKTYSTVVVPLIVLALIPLFVDRNHGASSIEVGAYAIQYHGHPSDLTLAEGFNDTTFGSDALHITSHDPRSTGVGEVAYGDLYQDTDGRYYSGREVATRVDSWAGQHGRATRVRWNISSPKTYPAPSYR